MVTRISYLLFIIHLQHTSNSPLRLRRSPLDLQPNQHLLIPTHTVLRQNLGHSHSVSVIPHNTHSLSVLPHNTQTVSVLPQNVILTKHKGLLAPIPLSQLLLPKLQLVPQQLVPQNNIIHNAVQHVHNKDVKIPVYTQTVSHNGNVTHPPLILIHSHLVPVHDLSVIPLQRSRGEQKVLHYRMEKKEEEPTSQYRNFYGGFGNGLFFGGHGSGHGFYAYGK